MENGFSHRGTLSRHPFYAWLSLGAAALAAGFLAKQAWSAPLAVVEALEQPRIPGQLVVKLEDGSGIARVRDALLGLLPSGSLRAVDPFSTDRSLLLVRLEDRDAATAMRLIAALPGVRHVEPDYEIRVLGWREKAASAPRLFFTEAGLPNDPGLGLTWGIHNTGQSDSIGTEGKAGSDVRVVPVWERGLTGSRDALVAVIDTGVDWDHPDLMSNLWTNPGEAGDLATNGKDDDGNGFVDDTHGWNFYGNNRDSDDDHDHGTHVSGTIGAVGNDGQGVAGVNWQVSILAVKFLSASGSGSLQGAINAINYAKKMGARIMSNSWGTRSYSETLKQAIDATKEAGVLFVAAAGNDGAGSPSYPGGFEGDHVLGVAATDNQDRIASFSNVHKKLVHVAAPGVRVYSTVRDGGYDTFSGTSMATPHASGVAALLLSIHPEWGFAELKSRMMRSSDFVENLRSKVVARGRLSTVGALDGIVPPNADPAEDAWTTIAKTVESPHSYPNGYDKTYSIEEAGAKFIRVHFSKAEFEDVYDKVSVVGGDGETLDVLAAATQDYWSDFVEGAKISVRLKSDESGTGWGFKVDKIQVVK